ncbi:MAG: dTDP-4-dehydrorhamnose 3,5-epimerase family protein [Acidimicrobiales bacterium]|jgi:dTDP-4-dehydrorhamnose 3,5-epimerase|nr:dTDP-4-dehydrorhamnose 3,5-epimerase family protein [Acidimicrobiales bacterium]
MNQGVVDPAEVPGLTVDRAFRADDDRGRFVKIHSAGSGAAGGVAWDEVYYSTSSKGVVRGMHLQLPPHDHHKAVHCLKGRAADVVVDLRAGSPTHGRHAVIELDEAEPTVVVVPPGCAHGFQALTDDTVMLYLVSSIHAPEADGGVRYDSFGCRWPLPPTSVSDRDRSLPGLAAFAVDDPRPWRS